MVAFTQAKRCGRRLRCALALLTSLILVEVIHAADSPQNAAEQRGLRVYQRYCAVCHMGGVLGLLEPHARPLSKHSLQRGEVAVRTLILEGGDAMPGYKYTLRADQLDDILTYLRSVDTPAKFVGSDRADP